MNHPLLFNPAASFDFGYDNTQQRHELGYTEGNNYFEFELDEATANLGEAHFLETVQ